MNLRYQIPYSEAPADDPALVPVKEYLTEQGVDLNIVPMGARINVNPKRMTLSFFAFAQDSDGRRLLQRNRGRGMKRKRMTFPITALPPAEIGELVAS